MSQRPSTIEEIFPEPPEDVHREALDLSRVPEHVAIIMDGNGRWAQARGLSRGEGHKAGIKAVREAITTCNDIGVRYLTIYSFSTENWKRSKAEVAGLMELFAKTMLAEVDGLMEESVRIRIFGDLSALPVATRKVLQAAEKRSADNTGMTLGLALNYGSRAEIARAVKELAVEVENKERTADSIDEDAISQHLYTSDIPDPDLLIRTSGEFRLSNFLLWQIAYSEMYVTDVLWPDFDRYELLRGILSYQSRDRRFGGAK